MPRTIAKQTALLLSLVCVSFACTKRTSDPAAGDVLLSEIQTALAGESSTCKLEAEQGSDKLIERLEKADVDDIASVKTPAYVIEPAVELVLRNETPQGSSLSVLVYLRDGQCERFQVAEMWR